MTGHAKLLEDYSYRGTQTAQRGKDVQIASSELTFSGSREPLIVNSLISELLCISELTFCSQPPVGRSVGLAVGGSPESLIR